MTKALDIMGNSLLKSYNETLLHLKAIGQKIEYVDIFESINFLYFAVFMSYFRKDDIKGNFNETKKHVNEILDGIFDDIRKNVMSNICKIAESEDIREIDLHDLHLMTEKKSAELKGSIH